nr:Mobile element protein [Escherichia coli]
MCRGQDRKVTPVPAVFHFRRITLNPAVNRVIDIHSAFSQHLLSWLIAVLRMPAYGPQNDVTLKMPKPLNGFMYAPSAKG